MILLEELKIKLMLTLARDRMAMQGRVRSVGFIKEYKTLPDDLGVHTLSQYNEEEITRLAEAVSIKPKPEHTKFHLYLNDIRYRLSMMGIHQDTIIDKYSRKSFEQLSQHCSFSLSHIDYLIDNLLKQPRDENAPLRYSIKELNAHYPDAIAALEAAISYVRFIGDENGPAIHQAEGLFRFEDALNMNTWSLLTKKQAVDYVIENGLMLITPVNEQLMHEGWLREGIAYEVSILV